MKIIHDKENCIGCGVCAEICPKSWKMSDDGKSFLLGSKLNSNTKKYEKEVGEIDCNQEAVNSCPVNVIKIEK